MTDPGTTTSTTPNASTFPTTLGTSTAPVTEPGKTFTQAEVDSLIRNRAERVAADKYGDYTDLKAKAARLDQIEAANATELEKAVKAARDEGRAEVQTAANGRLVAAEARALAAEAKFRNPVLATRAIDLSGVRVSDDGTPDAAAIKTLLGDLARDNPYLVDDGAPAKPKPDATQGPRGGVATGADQGREQARKRFGPPAGQQTNN